MSTGNLHKAAARLGEAVIDPSRWPDLMDEICRDVGARGAVLLQSDVRTADVPRTASIAQEIDAYFKSGWSVQDVRAKRGVPLLIQGSPVVFDQDFITPDEIRRSGFYNDCLIPLVITWFAVVGFWAGGAHWGLSIQRSGRQGPFGIPEKMILATLAPRLTETATLSDAVGRASLLGMTNALNLVRCPALALDRNGLVLDVNEAAAALFDDDIRVHARALILRDRGARADFERFRMRMSATPEGEALPVDPIVVRRDGRAPIVIRVLPVDGPARSPFLGACALLVFSDLSGGDEPEHCILKQVFGLTHAEDRLARHLARGLSLDQAAAAAGIAHDTARNQLRSIFAKTETHRQAELLALLGRL